MCSTLNNPLCYSVVGTRINIGALALWLINSHEKTNEYRSWTAGSPGLRSHLFRMSRLQLLWLFRLLNKPRWGLVLSQWWNGASVGTMKNLLQSQSHGIQTQSQWVNMTFGGNVRSIGPNLAQSTSRLFGVHSSYESSQEPIGLPMSIHPHQPWAETSRLDQLPNDSEALTCWGRSAVAGSSGAASLMVFFSCILRNAGCKQIDSDDVMTSTDFNGAWSIVINYSEIHLN